MLLMLVPKRNAITPSECDWLFRIFSLQEK